MKTQFLIGAANSGAGKTTFTVGLLRALKNRGLNVQPYKCGPDYIDTQYHTLASGNVSVNLDTWMASGDHVRDIYSYYARPADCCVAEGVMGLFDGYRKMEGSSAAIAELLNIPVLLVVNAASSAYSVAATIYGFAHFHPGIRVAGVIFNQVSSWSHFSFLQDACADVGVECLGYLPKADDIAIPSRHLGLSLAEQTEMESYISRIAALVEKHVDLTRLIETFSCPDPAPAASRTSESGTLKISVAKDEAFSFMYRENIEQLRRLGQVTFFSPIHDENLPETDLLYLPGGYPELCAEALERAAGMKEQIRSFALEGGKVFAECGGMIYLGRTLRTEGRTYEMAGVLPIDTTMEGARLNLGYRSMICNGQKYTGHEFHYSRTVDPFVLPSAAQQCNARGAQVDVPLYRQGNVIAGYTHWYWGEKDFLDFWK